MLLFLVLLPIVISRDQPVTAPVPAHPFGLISDTSGGVLFEVQRPSGYKNFHVIHPVTRHSRRKYFQPPASPPKHVFDIPSSPKRHSGRVSSDENSHYLQPPYEWVHHGPTGSRHKFTLNNLGQSEKVLQQFWNGANGGKPYVTAENKDPEIDEETTVDVGEEKAISHEDLLKKDIQAALEKKNRGNLPKINRERSIDEADSSQLENSGYKSPGSNPLAGWKPHEVPQFEGYDGLSPMPEEAEERTETVEEAEIEPFHRPNYNIWMKPPKIPPRYDENSPSSPRIFPYAIQKTVDGSAPKSKVSQAAAELCKPCANLSAEEEERRPASGEIEHVPAPSHVAPGPIASVHEGDVAPGSISYPGAENGPETGAPVAPADENVAPSAVAPEIVAPEAVAPPPAEEKPMDAPEQGSPSYPEPEMPPAVASETVAPSAVVPETVAVPSLNIPPASGTVAPSAVAPSAVAPKTVAVPAVAPSISYPGPKDVAPAVAVPAVAPSPVASSSPEPLPNVAPTVDISAPEAPSVPVPAVAPSPVAYPAPAPVVEPETATVPAVAPSAVVPSAVASAVAPSAPVPAPSVPVSSASIAPSPVHEHEHSSSSYEEADSSESEENLSRVNPAPSAPVAPEAPSEPSIPAETGNSYQAPQPEIPAPSRSEESRGEQVHPSPEAHEQSGTGYEPEAQTEAPAYSGTEAPRTNTESSNDKNNNYPAPEIVSRPESAPAPTVATTTEYFTAAPAPIVTAAPAPAVPAPSVPSSYAPTEEEPAPAPAAEEQNLAPPPVSGSYGIARVAGPLPSAYGISKTKIESPAASYGKPETNENSEPEAPDNSYSSGSQIPSSAVPSSSSSTYNSGAPVPGPSATGSQSGDSGGSGTPAPALSVSSYPAPAPVPAAVPAPPPAPAAPIASASSYPSPAPPPAPAPAPSSYAGPVQPSVIPSSGSSSAGGSYSSQEMAPSSFSGPEQAEEEEEVEEEETQAPVAYVPQSVPQQKGGESSYTNIEEDHEETNPTYINTEEEHTEDHAYEEQKETKGGSGLTKVEPASYSTAGNREYQFQNSVSGNAKPQTGGYSQTGSGYQQTLQQRPVNLQSVQPVQQPYVPQQFVPRPQPVFVPQPQPYYPPPPPPQPYSPPQPVFPQPQQSSSCCGGQLFGQQGNLCMPINYSPCQNNCGGGGSCGGGCGGGGCQQQSSCGGCSPSCPSACQSSCGGGSCCQMSSPLCCSAGPIPANPCCNTAIQSCCPPALSSCCSSQSQSCCPQPIQSCCCSQSLCRRRKRSIQHLFGGGLCTNSLRKH